MIYNYVNAGIREAAINYIKETKDDDHEKNLFLMLLAKKDYLFCILRQGLDYENSIEMLEEVNMAIDDKVKGGIRWKQA